MYATVLESAERKLGIFFSSHSPDKSSHQLLFIDRETVYIKNFAPDTADFLGVNRSKLRFQAKLACLHLGSGEKLLHRTFGLIGVRRFVVL